MGIYSLSDGTTECYFDSKVAPPTLGSTKLLYQQSMIDFSIQLVFTWSVWAAHMHIRA
mgnify:CR=1 FL=1